MNNNKPRTMTYRNLTLDEIAQLREQGCRCNDWELISVAEDFNPRDITDTRFEGEIHIGAGVKIDRVGVIRTTDGATFGQGVTVSVKNEAGDGNVILYSALTSQTAALMVQNAEDKQLFSKLSDMTRQYIDAHTPTCTTIGNGVTITDCRELTNVCIGDNCELCGASRMIDCTLTAANEASVYIGDDVIMENVIVQAGATIVDGARLYDSFVGEACHIGRGFTSESSLFFANSHMDNGEACAALCGPFAVSHHKSSLLIGGEYSFYNAGSGTNFSNHAYKMGPIHYGTMERGAKTASGAHILWPAKIGAFSMAMGKIETHPDTSLFPFSYVIGGPRRTSLKPGQNLCTVGTYRDIVKWPKRDKRPLSARRSLITFDWLSPYIIERIKKAIATLEQLQEEQGSDADEYTMNGFSISASALQRGLFYYDMALRMYEGSDTTTEWTDLLGLLAPTEAVQQVLEDILSGDISTIEMLEDHMHDIYDSYAQWKGYNDNDAEREQAIAEWKEAIRRDAEREYEMGDVSEEQLADFLEGLKN